MKGNLRKLIISINYINQILNFYVRFWYEALKKMKHNSIFMQDNVEIHKFKETMLWLKTYEIETLKWPSSSSDLNFDEYMWKCYKQKIQAYRRMILTSKDIWPAAQYKWNELMKREIYIKWIHNISQRCRNVIKNRGFSTKWWHYGRKFLGQDSHYVQLQFQLL